MRRSAAAKDETIPAKQLQILDGARQVFAEHGYERATVDQIAARAGASKATVYAHFQDKRSLFVAAVVQTCEQFRRALERDLSGPAADVEAGLEELGERFMTASLTPGVASLYRQVIAEAVRIPEIGRAAFECGTIPLQRTVASHLQRWADAGALRIDDVRSATMAFIALCQGDLVVRMRLGVLERPIEEQVRESVRRAVSIFVRAYRP